MRITEVVAMVEQERTDQHVPVETIAKRPQRQRTVEDFWRLIISNEYSAVRQPTIHANNFELKSALITMVQQHQFIGHPCEDPNVHLRRFLRMENTVNLNEVNPDILKL